METNMNTKGSASVAAAGANAATAQLQLPPGFRFHPTDEELVVHYLARRASSSASSKPFPIPIIAEVDLYKFDPWELPEKALFGEKEWYFFSPRDRKYPNGARPNRAAGSGYWKATGTDKPIVSQGSKAGVKKALVFYRGRAPKGVKTNWIMHEYRLAEGAAGAGTRGGAIRKKGTLRLDDWVLCRIYKKNASSPAKILMHQQQQQQCQQNGPEAKLDADDESCLEEVLASLPDIDDSKMCLPRLGSFTAMLSSEQRGNNPHAQQQTHGQEGIISGMNLQNLQQQQQQQQFGLNLSSNHLRGESVAVHNDPIVDNSACVFDHHHSQSFFNLPSLRQMHHNQRPSYSFEQKPNIGLSSTGGEQQQQQNLALQQQQMRALKPQLDSMDDEVQSSCRLPAVENPRYSPAAERGHHHHHHQPQGLQLNRTSFQQEQQHNSRMNHHLVSRNQFPGLTGYFFQHQTTI